MKLILNISIEVIIQRIYSRNLSQQQFSGSMFIALECVIYIACEHITCYYQGDKILHSFSLTKVFVPMDFSLVRFFNEAVSLRECRKSITTVSQAQFESSSEMLKIHHKCNLNRRPKEKYWQPTEEISQVQYRRIIQRRKSEDPQK